jgi:hypothetical protein
VVPVPERAALGLPADVTRPTVDEKLPAAVGANDRATATIAPGARVVPLAGSPVALKGAVGGLALLTDTAAVPSFTNVTDPDWDRPTSTVPKSTAGGLADTCGPANAPEPCRLTPILPWEVVTVSVPAALPTAVGEKVTVTESVWPAFSVCGSGADVLVTAYGPPEIEVLETVVAAVAVRVTVCEAVAPTATFPNVRLLGETVGGEAVWFPNASR